MKQFNITLDMLRLDSNDVWQTTQTKFHVIVEVPNSFNIDNTDEKSVAYMQKLVNGINDSFKQCLGSGYKYELPYDWDLQYHATMLLRFNEELYN
jgi:hypothetical protein